MPPIIRHYCELRVHKGGNGEDEYEDACARNSAGDRFAIADGATESSFADYWAKLLVEGFVASTSDLRKSWPDWLPPLQKQWADVVDAKDLPYFAKNKAQNGAFATFVGLTFQKRCFRKLPRWSAVAIGDACLFLIRDGRFKESFPLSKAEDFNSSPDLIGSRLSRTASLCNKEVHREGDCLPGDCFWLMTDALSQWFLKQVEADTRPWELLTPFLQDDPSRPDFVSWVKNLRDTEEIRNDDVTLMGIAL